jgi:molecular chaperone HscB
MFDFSRNHFELFGLPVGFVIDSSALAARYRTLQQVVHPDRFAADGATSQRLSLQRATLVNEAYDTLRDPLKRARYLLALKGVEPAPDHQTVSDPAFLMQQMELREALAAVRSAVDPATVLDGLMREIGGMIRSQVAQLAVQFEDSTPEQLEAAGQTVQRMQFLNRLLAEAEAIEADLEEAV